MSKSHGQFVRYVVSSALNSCRVHTRAQTDNCYRGRGKEEREIKGKEKGQGKKRGKVELRGRRC